MQAPKIVFLAFLLPWLVMSCVTSADMRALSEDFRSQIAAAEARTGESFEEFDGIPATLDELARKQEALEAGSAGIVETVGGGLGAIALAGFAAYKKAKTDVNRERDNARIVRHEPVGVAPKA